LGGVDLEVGIVDDAAATGYLVDVPRVARIVLAFGGVTEEGFLVQRHQHVDFVDVRVDRDRGGGNPIVAVLAHDVRVKFDVGEDVETPSAQRLGIDLR
jgi:hypothetical protein